MSSIRNFEKLFLNVPYEEREWAKNEGLKFDGEGKCWYLPPGGNPLSFRKYWAYLENTYDDREDLKRRGCRYNRKLKKFYVPDELNFDDFIKWWPGSLNSFVFAERYVIRSYVEKSGQAEVFCARDVEDGSYFAIKYFLADILGQSTATLKKSYIQEMRSLTDLGGHPNVLEVAAFDKMQDGDSIRYFIITPWIPGGTLSNWIGASKEGVLRSTIKIARDNGRDISEEDEQEFVRNKLNQSKAADIWLDRADILLSILDGLVHVQSKGIYHRDIKPRNILLDVPYSEDEDEITIVPVICDFGTSKLVDPYNPDNLINSKNTLVEFRTAPYRPEYSWGSLEYQKEINNQHTWDLFSWGIITVELLANRKIDDSSAEARKILKNEISPSLDEEILNLIASAIAVDPDDRPGDIEVFQRKIKKLTEKRRKMLGCD